MVVQKLIEKDEKSGRVRVQKKNKVATKLKKSGGN